MVLGRFIVLSNMREFFKNYYQTLFFGLVITTVFFFIFRPSPVWLDEAALGFNIITKNFNGLFKPLDYHQVAPIGFLLLSKFCCLLFGYSDFTLRLPSILALLFTCYFLIFNPLFRKHKFLSLISIIILSRWIFYGFELKQYIFDVLSLSGFYYQYYQEQKLSLKWVVFFVILGWGSNIALLLIPLLLGTQVLIRGQLDFQILKNLLLLVVSTLFYYWFFIKGHPYTGSMDIYWNKHFLPFRLSHIPSWILNHFLGFMRFNVNLGSGKLRLLTGSLISITILIQFWKYALRYNPLKIFQNNHVLITPFFFAVILSLLRIYPMDSGRLSLYLAIPFTFIIFKALRSIKFNSYNILQSKIKSFVFTGLVLFSFSRVWYFKFISPNQDIRQYMNAPEDELTIFTGSTIKHFDYYKSINKKNNINTHFLYRHIDLIDTILIPDRQDFKRITIVEAHSKRLQIKNPQGLVVNKMNYQLSQKKKSTGVNAYIFHQLTQRRN